MSFQRTRFHLAVATSFLALSLPTSNALAGYIQTNLVTDDQTNLINSGFAPAAYTDPNLVNPWGMSFSSTSPFWVSNNGSGNTTLYNGQGQPQPLVVTIPPLSGSAPTGQVFNPTSDFVLSNNSPARFLFATEGGTLAAWNPGLGTTAIIVDNSATGAIYKGLALGTNGSGSFLYAADFNNARIDVFDSNFGSATLPGSFTDPNLPAGYAPFNIQNLGGTLYVAYAKQGSGGEEQPGPGLGYVDAYDTDGSLLQRVVSSGALDAPWGLAIAPADFGELSDALLVGNFGDGVINGFDPITGAPRGSLTDLQGNPIVIDGLWALMFGNGGNGGNQDTLYFTAGINDEEHGLFGSLFGSLSVPEPSPLSLALVGLAPLAWRAWARRSGCH